MDQCAQDRQELEQCDQELDQREQELDQCYKQCEGQRTSSSLKRSLLDDSYMNNENRRTTTNDDEEQEKPKVKDRDNKTYKICSVEGGLDITRYISRDARSFFAGAIEDVELIREVISETANNGGVGHRITLAELNATLDRDGRGINSSNIRTTFDAGLSYVDDRPNRNIDIGVGLFYLGAEAMQQSYYNTTSKIDALAELAIIQAAAMVFPWIVDRKAKPKLWSIDHQNGRSTGSMKEPLRFDSLYSAAWIGSWGETWSYYPSLYKMAGGVPYSIFEAIGDPNGTTRHTPFIKANLPWNNPTREAQFTNPYPDMAEAGVSIISCLAPVYYTGSIANKTFDDTYIASTGVDIHIESISRLLDDATKLTNGSFAILVDFDLDVVVISQEVVEKIYPTRTGFEDERVTHGGISGEMLIYDRRNTTYLVSDTIYQGLSELENADWHSLRRSLKGLDPGERDYSKLNITLTGDEDAIEFYVMYEKWNYVADWALLMFAPVHEVDNAIEVRIVETAEMTNSFREVENVMLTVRKGSSISGKAAIRNAGTLDVALRPSGIPHWLKLQPPFGDGQILRAGHNLNLNFEVLTNELDVGITSSTLSFHIQDDSYPDCFYVQEKALRITVYVLLGYYFYLLIALFIITGFLVVYTYIERRKKEADSVWEVKKSELIYDDPPEILGRGTFGLVVCAEYRGTRVAVKRVIPTREGTTVVDVSTISAIFDYNDDFDEEELKPQKRYGTTELKPRRRISMGMVPGALKSVKPRRRITMGMVPGALKSVEPRRRISMGMVPGGLKSIGFIDKVQAESESAPLNDRKKENGHASLRPSSSGYGSKAHRSKSYLKGDFVQEMRVLSKLRHPCITTFMGAVTARGEEPLLVMECMNLGSLYDILHNPSMMFEGETILSILRDISQGMRFLHSSSPQIIHGDLKAANVLVDTNFRAKVTDFGFSIKKKVGASGTPYWMAPELLRGASNSAASDAYSFGIVLYEVFSRQDPYFGLDFNSAIRDICDPCINKRPPAPKSMPSEVTSLLYFSCLDASPVTRPNFIELDSFLKRFQVKNVDPGEQNMQQRLNSQSDRRLVEEIFPPPVAAALREGRTVEPEHFDCVTIFFSDIVGFTPLSSKMSPRKVSNMVDRLYCMMDSLSHKFGIYKLETIGDAWVGVTNLYNTCPSDHAKRMALFSVEASQAAGACLIDEEDSSQGYVKIRIGFHSGPCTGAVVGTRMPKYTLFGDTINTAARMESNSESGRIHCSNRSEELLRDQAPEIPVKCRGEINVKGKGIMKTFWVGNV